MADYVDKNGMKFELPKLTVSLSESLEDALDTAKGTRDRAAAQLKLMRDVLSADYIAQRCGGKTVDSVDVVELHVLTLEVDAAYRERVSAANMERNMQKLDDLQPVLQDFAKIESIMKAANSRQGFSRVV